MAKLLMPFSNPTTYAGHSGIDYGVPTGTPVRSSQPGVIVESRWFNNRSGYMRALKHDTGVIEKGYHLESLNGPKIGTYVPAGTPWAYTGNTGTATTGPHLHHEIWLGDWLRSGDGYWLYVDRSAWVGQGSSAGDGSTTLPKPVPEEDLSIIFEEDEMSKYKMYYTENPNYKYQVAVCNGDSGLWMEYVSNDATLNNRLATEYETGSAIPVSNSVFNVFRSAHAEVRANDVKLSGAVEVDAPVATAVDAALITQMVNDEDDRREQAERDILSRGGV